jgi:hypothetical protein
MTAPTVHTVETPDGYEFLRSDGQRFFLAGKENGHAVLYAGAKRDEPPACGIVDFDANFPDKLEAAQKYALAYPKHPF